MVLGSTNGTDAANWSSAFDQTSGSGGVGGAVDPFKAADNDPFASFSGAGAVPVAAADPFSSFGGGAAIKMSNTSNFDDLWSAGATTTTTTAAGGAKVDPFGAPAGIPSSKSIGFGADDNWATTAAPSSTGNWAAFDDGTFSNRAIYSRSRNIGPLIIICLTT